MNIWGCIWRHGNFYAWTLVTGPFTMAILFHQSSPQSSRQRDMKLWTKAKPEFEHYVKVAKYGYDWGEELRL